MKILLIAPQPFYQDRGTPIAVRLLAQTLGELGHDVHLLVFHEGEKIIIPNVTIHRNITIPGISNIKPSLSLKKLICDFFLFIKQRYSQSTDSEQQTELTAFSNHSANTIAEWLDTKEDDVWK